MASVTQLTQVIEQMNLDGILSVFAVRGAYLAGVFAILVARLTPALRNRLLAYGPRSSASSADGKATKPSNFLDKIASITVPHNWFASFYSFSITCSFFWAADFLGRGSVIRSLPVAASESESMTVRQVAVVWILMAIQGTRRLYECLTLPNSSKSQMWIGHWMVGIFFYLVTNVAVWIEGTSALQKHVFTVHDATLTGPDFRMFLGVNIFTIASGIQHDCHVYLASLKTSTDSSSTESKDGYRLPDHPAFRLSCTPHYFAECLIYLSLAIIGAPPGSLLNWTLASTFFFVVVILGVTAEGTKKWYEQRFGAEAVSARARMIPYVF